MASTGAEVFQGLCTFLPRQGAMKRCLVQSVAHTPSLGVWLINQGTNLSANPTGGLWLIFQNG